MKKIVSILLIFSVIIALCLNVSAASVYDVGSFTKTSYLSITNGQATCKSSYSESNGNTASVKITQSLEKHSFLWFWDTVGGEWTTNSKKSSVSFTNYKSGLASGKIGFHSHDNKRTDRNGYRLQCREDNQLRGNADKNKIRQHKAVTESSF